MTLFPDGLNIPVCSGTCSGKISVATASRNKIGAGGMGVVFLAHDKQLERQVAIKVLPPGTLADDAARKRFRQEALSLAKLNHPNIATIHDFDTADEIDFLVTEFIAGDTLDKKLASGPLRSKEVVRLGLQLAQGLGAAHAQGIIHRDLKPANLRLTTDGRLKILDFGLAQFVHPEGDLAVTASLTSSQQITGTLPYMAPEQLRGEPADRRTDIWALGVVLYELATGKRPFPETHGPMLINAIFNQEPDLPRRINPRISEGLESVIWKALRKNRADRYQTVSELEHDLERLTAGISPQTRLSRRVRQRLLLWAAPVLIVLFIARGLSSAQASAGDSGQRGPHETLAAQRGHPGASRTSPDAQIPPGFPPRFPKCSPPNWLRARNC